MKLDLSSLDNALASLQKAVDRSRLVPADEEIRDAVIQRFEYTYELSCKMLKRQMEQEVSNPAELDQLGFRDLLRLAAERGLLSDIENWMDFRNQRNITSHAYDRVKAQSVYQTAIQFADNARTLLEELKRRNA